MKRLIVRSFSNRCISIILRLVRLGVSKDPSRDAKGRERVTFLGNNRSTHANSADRGRKIRIISEWRVSRDFVLFSLSLEEA